ERHVSFLIIGIGAASLSAVFFYKIAARYTRHPFQLAVFYSLLPWLFFAAHHGLNEPLLMLFLLAGFYYYLQDRPWAYSACFALAMLSKELAALPVLAMSVLLWRRHGWRRVMTFAAVALLPFATFCLAYGVRWGDCLWCLKESPENPLENSFSWKTGFWWMYLTLRTGTKSSANPHVALAYDVLNQVLNVLLLLAVGIGTYRLKRLDRELFLYNAIVAMPLLFLGRNQYMLNSSLGRQFLIAALVLIGFDRMNLRGSSFGKRCSVVAFFVAAGMLFLGILWLFLYSTFFVHHKLF
ncbi:MAG: glycosyltransferase 87 family protein, partial [Anaerolineae bacterium]